MTNPNQPGSVTAVVAGIIASLPESQISAPAGAWHWAFLQLRDRHGQAVPELRKLEFIKNPGSFPVSERLEGILQMIDIAGTGSTLNPTLMVRQFDKTQKERLKRRVAGRIKGRRTLIRGLGKELRDLLQDAPTVT